MTNDEEIIKLPTLPNTKMSVPETIAKDYYCIPKWCRMHPYSHFDGMGGCWGISGGLVLAQGENYCLACDYHMNNIKPPRKPEEP